MLVSSFAVGLSRRAVKVCISENKRRNIPMPLLKFHILRGRSKDEIAKLLDVAHEAMVASFLVPERDRYQILTEHDAGHFNAQDTGLDIPRSDHFILVEVVSRPRSRQQKQAFYERLCADFQQFCGVEPSDVMISVVENSNDDWSFGHGRAQFVTGEL
jgi:phenylpyruvate tautomerase PptA (4-oxalocrotonate tautomerase family)